MLEQLKEQHSRRVEDLQAELGSKVSLGRPLWIRLPVCTQVAEGRPRSCPWVGTIRGCSIF